MNFEGFLRCCGYWGSWVCRSSTELGAKDALCACHKLDALRRNQRLGILPIGTLEQMSCQPTLGKPLVLWNGLIFTQKEVVEYLSLAMHFGEREQRNRNHNLRATSGHFYTFKQRKTGAKKVMGYPPPKKTATLAICLGFTMDATSAFGPAGKVPQIWTSGVDPPLLSISAMVPVLFVLLPCLGVRDHWSLWSPVPLDQAEQRPILHP